MNMIIPTMKLIQSGDRTHTQDQSILPSSLSIMNTIVSNPLKPIPLE
jgi:hypothetical protein